MLLETKDWNEKGEYVPNKENGIASYDYLVLLRVDAENYYVQAGDMRHDRELLQRLLNYKRKNVK